MFRKIHSTICICICSSLKECISRCYFSISHEYQCRDTYKEICRRMIRLWPILKFYLDTLKAKFFSSISVFFYSRCKAMIRQLIGNVVEHLPRSAVTKSVNGRLRSYTTVYRLYTLRISPYYMGPYYGP